MAEGTDMNQIEKAMSDYLGEMCGMRLKPHALTGLAKAAIAAQSSIRAPRIGVRSTTQLSPPRPQEAVMQSDIVQRLDALIERQRDARGDMLYKGSADPELVDAHATIAALEASLRQNMTDTGRLLWKDEAQSVCPSISSCFEYGDTVRCGPCAIHLAENAGVEPNTQIPALPEVSRLRRENDRLKASLRAAEEREKALREALAWYGEKAAGCRRITREGDDARYALDRDRGERARQALAGAKP